MSADFAPPALLPLERWFAEKGWSPFAFQREVWAAYLAGESGLIHSPTGSGKTLAAWGGLLAEAAAEAAPLRLSPQRAAPGRKTAARRADAPPLRALWITPLRALAADTAAALAEPAAALGLSWTIETRTSDTKSSLRARQRDQLPTVLVTTPESLSLLLANDRAPDLFTYLRLVVCDEWHELMASKRGVQAELALARLRTFARASAAPLRIWGVSATLGNLADAERTLLGMADPETGEIPRGRIVRGAEPKPVEVAAIIPASMERFPWAGHLGLRLLPAVVAQIERAETTLVFTNTRAQTELWFDALIDARPDWIGAIALHHGSLAPDVRAWVEDALKHGRLRCVVCTSTLDLGVDFAPVEQVIQVGSPKSIARLLQRAGRSGHRPGVPSRVFCVPTHALELVEVAGARAVVARGEIEARPPVHKPLDVLAQHLVTVALGGGFAADALYDEVRSTAAYQALTREEWAWALGFVTHGGALAAYEQFRRVAEVDGRFTVPDRRIAQLHRMSIGTIMSDPLLTVQFIRGEKLGSIDEGFASRLRPGDRFTLAGRTLEFVRLREMTVWVRRASSNRGVVPRWQGGNLPISGHLAWGVRRELEKARAGVWDGPEMEAVRPILELQARWSRIPAVGELLIEATETREGHHRFFYPFAGRLAHEGMAALVAYRISREQPITFTIAVNDYGFELLSPDAVDIAAWLPRLLAPDGLLPDLIAGVNAAELAKRQFREIARVAGLIAPRYPGGSKTARQLQASSSLLYDVFEQYDPDNLLLEQARREVLERQLDGGRLLAALDAMRAAEAVFIATRRPTPFAFPLFVERLRQTLTSEKLEDRIRRMLATLEREADRG